MVRLACIDVPELPLQLLLLRHPEWRYQPACVVEQDRPQAQLLWVNEVARQAGVLPGMRFSAALGLAAGLKAEVVDHINILQMVTQLGTAISLSSRRSIFSSCGSPRSAVRGAWLRDVAKC